MDRIGVVGLNWRRGGPRTLAEYTLPVETRSAAVAQLACDIGVEELVYIATCNRVEVAFVTAEDVDVSEYRRRIHAALSGKDQAPGEAERLMRAWHGEGAAEHVFLVATGLDSARLGETEIAGQVRAALELSREAGLAGARLGLLYEEALKLSKRTRLETSLGEGRTSLAEIGLDRVREQLTQRPGRVALIGVSPMTERCARCLVEEGGEVLLVNRSLDRVRDLARKLGPSAAAVALDEFQRNPQPVTAVISATAAPGPILAGPELDRLRQGGATLFVDFAVDPDVDPAAATELGLERFGMDEVLAEAERNRERRLHESGEARDLVDLALEHFSGRLARRRADQAIGAMCDAYLTTARTQVEKLLEVHLSDLDPERAELLRRFAARLARHFAHLPASGLRQIASTHGPEVVQDFFSHAHEDLNHRLDQAIDAARIFASLAEDEDA
jgi:glutamyl-tRNA reductase